MAPEPLDASLRALWFDPTVPILLALLGALLSWWVTMRLTGDRVCGMLLLVAYGLKVLLAFGFYYVAYFGWHMLGDSQLGWLHAGPDGFWSFSDDAQAYHNYAATMVRAWEGQAQHSEIFFGNWAFVVYMALVYRGLGIHPLTISVFNAWYGTVAALAAWLMLRQLKVEAPRRRLGVGLVALWPSFVLWSSQSMKESLILALILVALSQVMILTRLRPINVWTWLGLSILLGSGVWSLVLFRGYIGRCIVVALVVMGSWRVLQSIAAKKLAPVVRILGTIGVVALAMQLAGRADPIGFALQHALRPPYHSAPSAPESLESPTAPPASPPASASQPDPSVNLLQHVVDEVSGRRQGFVSTGGDSLVDQEVNFRRPIDLLGYLPRALSLALFAPFPRQWVEAAWHGSIGQVLAALDVLLIYWLLVSVLIASVRHGVRVSAEGLLLLGFSALVALPMCLTVANFGTLFRLRLQFLLPLVLLMSSALPYGRQRLAPTCT